MNLLLDSEGVKCRFINKTIVNDSYGAPHTLWSEGAEFTAFINNPNHALEEIAKIQGVKATYKIITPMDVVLKYGDVIQRIKDERYFKITSDGDDKKSPHFATMQVREADAEKINTLPKDGENG